MTLLLWCPLLQFNDEHGLFWQCSGILLSYGMLVRCIQFLDLSLRQLCSSAAMLWCCLRHLSYGPDLTFCMNDALFRIETLKNVIVETTTTVKTYTETQSTAESTGDRGMEGLVLPGCF